jgi:hypothetical protein
MENLFFKQSGRVVRGRERHTRAVKAVLILAGGGGAPRITLDVN